MARRHRPTAGKAIPAAALATHARALALLQSGQIDAADAEMVRLMPTLPHWAEGQHLHGLIAQAGGRLIEAQTRIERAIKLNPDVANYHTNLAVVLIGRRMPSAAIEQCLAALKLEPTQFGAMINLGLALSHLDRPAEALAAFEGALTVRRDFAPLYGNIGRMENALGNYPAAVGAYRQAAALAPNAVQYAMGQAINLSMLGRTRESADLLATIVRRWPDHLPALGARCFALNYLPEVTPAEQAEAARAYGRVLARQVTPMHHQRRPDAMHKVLRVGFVSADLRNHSVSLFLRSLLPHLDRIRFTLVAYSSSSYSDATTEALRPLFAEWVDAALMSDSELADRIAEDSIDILLDLSGHTLGGRLPVFARKPAPVSASWLGYSGTTGVDAIDYLVCDQRVVPQADEDMIVERPWRLPRGFLCLPHNSDVAPVPRSERGGFTFGSFNNLNKLSDTTIATWARILHGVEGSRLLLKARSLAEASEREATVSRFAAHGIDGARLTLLGRTATVADHLALYGEMDLALDPFPYNGTTTTMQALRMGVPVITLEGDRFIGRVGASLLANAGLADWIAPDVEAYVAMALKWAGHREGLARLRSELPARMAVAPMADLERFGADFGDMLAGMWRNWCLAPDTSASSSQHAV